MFVNVFRIRQEKNGGAWCPKAQISSEVREYLEIDLDEDHLVTWTETQGRWGNGQGQEYTEAFTVEYWRKSIKRWVEYKDSRDNKVCVLTFRMALIIKISQNYNNYWKNNNPKQLWVGQNVE